MNQIELINLSKSYDGKTNVINNVSLEVKQGEFVILVGPSGCGKSTLLRMIAGLEPINAGTLMIDGKVANKMLPKDRNLSMVFQNYALYPHMTVRANILFGLDIKKVSKEEQLARLNNTAKMVGLSGYLERKPGQLSGGQRQRVALARSICSHSPICLMDEPLSNLDAKLRAQMRSEIRRIQRQLGLTIVYVTHDQVEAMTMGDRIVVLNEGVVQQVGTPVELYNKPANRFVASFIGSPQINMLESVVHNDKLVFNEEMEIQLDERLKKILGEAKVWDIGVRSEHIRYSAAKTEYSHQVKVINVEFMGNETQIVFALGNFTYTAKWPGQWAVEAGTSLLVELNPEYYYIFNKDSGNLMHSPNTYEKNCLKVMEGAYA